VSEMLVSWNSVPAATAVNEILPCCGSRAWAEGIVARRPLRNEETLLAAADEIWRSLAESDWLEAFRSHPRIGESRAGGAPACAEASTQSAIWSEQEQHEVKEASDASRAALAEGNRVYENKFNRIFIVCAAGKSPAEILAILQRRLKNDESTELREAGEQQRQITQLRLQRWLQG
jgi:2-oxo-4-hydroxy-4-carboxy-5-ureidoimidazoline decarboxylase